MKHLFTALFLSISFSLFSQSVHRCGTVEIIQARNEAQPGYSAATKAVYQEALRNIDPSARGGGEVYQVPVVVHILHHDAEENLSADLVYSQIARLNKDYRRLNADTTETRAEFLPVAADAGIEFYLAGVDPDGNPTEGITWTAVDRSDFAPDLFSGTMDEMKQSSAGGVDAWDTEKYLNIWVCDLIGDNPLFQILGFAYPPSSAPNWPAGSNASSPELEGVAIHYKVFGENNPLAVGEFASAEQGRTAVHEVGHYLGLRHIWGDPNFLLGEDGCMVDDGLQDTPNAAENAAFSCDHTRNTCVDSIADLPDMIENFMDYASEDCMNMFTAEQTDILRTMLVNARPGLITDPVWGVGIQDEELKIEWSIQPNPTNGLVQVVLDQPFNIDNVELLDLQGRIVRSEGVGSFTSTISLDVSIEESGLYLLSLVIEGKRVNKRLMIN